MGHNLDLKQYQVRTDLAIDVTQEEQNGFTKEISKDDFTTVTTIVIDEEGEKNIHKKQGTYITIEFADVTDFHTAESIQESFQKHLKKLLLDSGIQEKDTCLVIGLGNDRSTPDALGPNTIDHILVTRHLFTLGTDIEEGFRSVAAVSPGVMGETGIETSDLILSVVETIRPDFLLIVDALASSSLERVNKTIQMTDTGIHPGSGVGNERKEISK